MSGSKCWQGAWSEQSSGMGNVFRPSFRRRWMISHGVYHMQTMRKCHLWRFPKSWGYPKRIIHILAGFFLINHPFWEPLFSGKKTYVYDSLCVYLCKNMSKMSPGEQLLVVHPIGDDRIISTKGPQEETVKIKLAVLNPPWCCLKYSTSEVKSERFFIGSRKCSEYLGTIFLIPQKKTWFSNLLPTCLHLSPCDISQAFPHGKNWLLAIPSKRASKVAMPAWTGDPETSCWSMLSRVPCSKQC